MTQPLPPAIGDLNWGTELNDYLDNTLMPQVTQNTSNFSTHVASAPSPATSSDPHGDRAYALQLMAPIQSGVNGPSGFVQLDANGRLPTKDAWHDLRPVTANFATNLSQWYPPQYRVNLDGEVRLAGYVLTTAYAYNGVLIFSSPLPSPYTPDKEVHLPVTVSAPGTADSFGTPMLVITTSGTMTFAGLPTGLAAATAIGLYGSYPIDASHSLIQS